VTLLGIHHITAIATEPQRNLDFYVRMLGLRLVKRTVNFDDPGSYHFYFGDRIGAPGTIMTFFPWPGARRGTRGAGQVTAIGFTVPWEAIDYWTERLQGKGIAVEEKITRFGEKLIRFLDPDGLLIEMVASDHPDDVDLDFPSDVPRQFAIRGFNTPTLEVQTMRATEELLRAFGFELVAEHGRRRRFALDERSTRQRTDPPGRTSARVDLLENPDPSFGNISAGTVHHIAFRCANEEQQLHWRQRIVDLGLHVTPLIDRQYFHSIYFREPGGILFEIATDGPGFGIDESTEELGSSLKLPERLEPRRKWIEATLPPIGLRRAAEA
jgi:glyoxalase family protein